MTLFCNFTRQEGPPETAPDARRAKDNGKSKYGTTNQSNMKTKKSGILILFLCIFCVVGCDNDDKKGREVTDYKEYILTVASRKVPGVLTSDGHNYLTDVYAVKKELSDEWIPFGNIEGFDFEEKLYRTLQKPVPRCRSKNGCRFFHNSHITK
mgnify:FL=1